jgi:hypothetical protein
MILELQLVQYFALASHKGDFVQSGLSSAPLKWGGFLSACPKATSKIELHRKHFIPFSIPF